MKAPQLLPKATHWQMLVMDPEGRWVCMQLDTLLVETTRVGPAEHVAAEAKLAVERLLRQGISDDQR